MTEKHRIKIITSNIVDNRHVLWFQNGQFEYHLKKQPDQTKIIDCSKITKLTYEKPSGSLNTSRGRGLGSALLNLFSAAKDIKKSGTLTFDAYFSDESYIHGVTNMETYFEIQDAWLETRNQGN